MKTGQAAKIPRYLPVARLAAVAVAGASLLAVFPGPLRAAIDPDAGGPPVRPALKLWTVAQTTAPPGSAVVPPVRREPPPAEPAAGGPATPAKAPEAQPAATDTKPAAPAAPPVETKQANPKQPDTKQAEPSATSVLGTIQDWLARANREYQGVIVKELSLPTGAPPPVEDAIAKKLKEQQAEDARKAADAKRAADDAAKAAAADAAAKAKAAEAKKLAEDKQRAEETKRLADEAKKKADELLKADSKPAPKPEAKPEPKPEAKPEVATPAAPAAPKTDDAARTAEQQRLEAERVAAEAKRQEQQRLAEEAKRAEDARKKAEAARAEAARIAEERRKAAAAKAAAEPKSTSRTIVLTPEPLPSPVTRPVDPGTTFRPEMASSSGTRRASRRADESDEPAPQRRRIRIYHEPTYRGITAASYQPVRGTAVKRWVWRAPNGASCRAAGRRITPPARYTIKRGDSLWRISERHYHQGRLYPKIYSANRATIADPDLIYPCQRVLVPR